MLNNWLLWEERYLSCFIFYLLYASTYVCFSYAIQRAGRGIHLIFISVFLTQGLQCFFWKKLRKKLLIWWFICKRYFLWQKLTCSKKSRGYDIVELVDTIDFKYLSDNLILLNGNMTKTSYIDSLTYVFMNH